MIVDLEQMRVVVDQMTPDLRNDMPKDATDYGNRMFGMFLNGMAQFLENDETPWDDIAASRDLRLRLATALRMDGVRMYYGLAEGEGNE